MNVNEVVVEADDVRSGEVAAAIDELVAQAGESETFIGPAEVTYSDDGTVAADRRSRADGNGTDDASIDALDEVRDDLVPATVGAVDGADANVTGGAAQTEDFNQVLNERMPLVFAFVLGLAFAADAGHVPLDRDPDQGDRAQPALRGRRLRRAGARVPERGR